MASSSPARDDAQRRLKALTDLELLDSPREQVFDDLVNLAARLLKAPTAAINFLTEDRLWTKAGHNIDYGQECHVKDSFCIHALDMPDVHVVSDAAADPTYRDLPWVEAGSRFYAGAQIHTGDGVPVGTICVLDDHVREASEEEIATLRSLAAAVSANLELRRQRAMADDQALQLATVIDQAPVGFVALDEGGVLLEWNAEAERMFGWCREEALGKVMAELVLPPETRERDLEDVREHARGRREREHHRALEKVVVHRDGTRFPVELSVATLQLHTETRYTIFARDISERRRHEDERREETAALTALAEITSVLASAGPDDDISQQLCVAALQITGADSAGLMAEHPDGGLVVMASTLEGAVGQRIARDERAVSTLVFESETTKFVGNVPAEGWELAAAYGVGALVVQPVYVGGKIAGTLVVTWDEPMAELPLRIERLIELLSREAATTLARAELLRELRSQSLTDALTGVANRRALDRELQRARARAVRSDEPLSIAVMDFDRFKIYNDTRGHGAGDELLRASCAAWSDALRLGDFVARYGGEEFVVLLPQCDAANAVDLVERLRALVPDGQTCSAGVATFNGSETAPELVHRADKALYRAKSEGRDTVRLG